jgi:F-type H+-transporting ATPase subunit b
MAKSHFTEELETEIAHTTQKGSLFAPDVSMAILTWVAFFLLLAVLTKYAWGPILAALEKREETLRKSLEEADRLKAELANIEATQKALIAKADEQAKTIIEKSRHAATEAAKHIQLKAREESQILLENAKREIQDELEKARSLIKEESIEIAVGLAEKLIEKNLDDAGNRRLINDFMKEN